LYEKPKARKDISYGNYVIEDYLQGLRVTQGYTKEVKVGPSAAIPQFEQQLAILKSANQRFESSIFDIIQLVQADLLDSELDAARVLHKSKFWRAAGAIVGVVIEKHLAQVCVNHNILISKKHPTISDFNDLLKNAGVIDIPQWRFIQHLGDLRNLCDHNKDKEPSNDEIEDLISGTEKITKTIF
jgi:aryl carrier-like protein